MVEVPVKDKYIGRILAKVLVKDKGFGKGYMDCLNHESLEFCLFYWYIDYAYL